MPPAVRLSPNTPLAPPTPARAAPLCPLPDDSAPCRLKVSADKDKRTSSGRYKKPSRMLQPNRLLPPPRPRPLAHKCPSSGPRHSTEIPITYKSSLWPVPPLRSRSLEHNQPSFHPDIATEQLELLRRRVGLLALRPAQCRNRAASPAQAAKTTKHTSSANRAQQLLVFSQKCLALQSRQPGNSSLGDLLTSA